MDDQESGGLILSNDEAKAVQEAGKAVQEVAKLGGRAIDAAGGVAAYLKEVMGHLPHDAVGLLGDAVKRARDRLAENAARKLKERGVEHPEPPSPSLLLPLVEHAEKESRPELADLWASLLATAMEPGRSHLIRRDFYGTLGEMEPADALVLGAVAQHAHSQNRDWSSVWEQLGALTRAEFLVSAAHLGLLKLIDYDPDGRGQLKLTPYGTTFLLACDPQSVPGDAHLLEHRPPPRPPSPGVRQVDL